MQGWMYRVEQLLEYYQIIGKQRVKITALHLEEAPLQWYKLTVRTKGKSLSWLEFEKGLISMYDSSAIKDYAGDLLKLKQEGYAYDQYQEEFMKLSHHVHSLPKEFLVSCFVSGLRETIRCKSPSEEAEVHTGSNDVR